MAQLRLRNIKIVVISLIINKIYGLSGQICSNFPCEKVKGLCCPLSVFVAIFSSVYMFSCQN